MIEQEDFKFAEPVAFRPLSEEEQRRKEENLRWLEQHCDWRPIGGEW